MSHLERCLGNLSSTRVEKIGIEVEGFYSGKLPKSSKEDGFFTYEAGRDIVELVSFPQNNVTSSIRTLRLMLEEINNGLVFEPFRNTQFVSNSGVWNDDPRYSALKTSLEMEVPGGGHYVNEMTNNAAIHLNFSGETIDPFGSDGVFLINMFNNIAPFLASRVHSISGLGKGHLSIWKKFALPERFPSSSRWFESSAAMVNCIESLPRLFQVDNSRYVICRKNHMKITNPTDLTFIWWFMRPKISEYGPYLELRYLPSVPLSVAERFIIEGISVIDILLEWFYVQNQGLFVSSAESSKAYKYLEEKLPFQFPDKPLSADYWSYLVDKR